MQLANLMAIMNPAAQAAQSGDAPTQETMSTQGGVFAQLLNNAQEQLASPHKQQPPVPELAAVSAGALLAQATPLHGSG